MAGSINGVSRAEHDADITDIANQKGAANGIATLGADGLVPVAQLPEVSGDSAYKTSALTYAERLMNLRHTANTYVEAGNFATLTGWSAGTAEVIDGVTTLRLPYPTATITKNYGGVFAGAATASHAFVRFYIHDKSGLQDITIYLYKSATDGKAKTIAASALANGWNMVCLRPTDFDTIGAGCTLSEVQIITLRQRFTVNQDAGICYAELALLELKPMLSIWFDDGKDTVFTEAFPKMAALGFNGSFALIGKEINHDGYVTSQKCKKLLAEGWDLCNHTYSHTGLTTFDYDNQEFQICRGIEVLQSLGVGASAYHIVPPQGLSDANTTLLAKKYCTCCRNSGGDNLLPVPDFYALKSREVTNLTSVATVQGWIDSAITNHYWLILLFHIISDAGTAGTFSAANFQLILDYLATVRANIDVVTPTMALADMRGAATYTPLT